MAIESVSMTMPTLDQVSRGGIASNEGIEGNPLREVDFSSIFKSALDRLNAEQVQASDKVKQVELGKSDDLVGAMVASQKASLNFAMLLQMRNKVLSGFQDIMRMPV